MHPYSVTLRCSACSQETTLGVAPWQRADIETVIDWAIIFHGWQELLLRNRADDGEGDVTIGDFHELRCPACVIVPQVLDTIPPVGSLPGELDRSNREQED